MKYLKKTQADIVKNPTLNLHLRDEKSKKFVSFEALLDTGFSGYLAINQKIAELLSLEFLGGVDTINADNVRVSNPLYKTELLLPDLDLIQTSFYATCISKNNQQDEIIIGSKLLLHICSLNEVKLIFDYNENEIYFEK